MEIDVCLVAGRRPDLLEATLDSFSSNLFRNFSIDQFLVNIDPIFGSACDQRRCEEIILRRYSTAKITKPETPGFCAAVRRLWRSTRADVVFHLEDDWLLHRVITPSDIEPLRNPRVKQICFNHAFKRWPIAEKGPYAYGRSRRKLLGFELPIKGARKTVFTTSPSFISGPFARQCEALMDVSLDPEKQFYRDVNLPLEAFVAPYLSMVLGEGPSYPICDIGRDWRTARSIEKRLVENQSIWVEAR